MIIQNRDRKNPDREATYGNPFFHSEIGLSR